MQFKFKFITNVNFFVFTLNPVRKIFFKNKLQKIFAAKGITYDIFGVSIYVRTSFFRRRVYLVHKPQKIYKSYRNHTTTFFQPLLFALLLLFPLLCLPLVFYVLNLDSG